MTQVDEKNHSTQPEGRKRVFVTHAQVLSEEQRRGLTEEEKEFEQNCQGRGVWLELFCPNDACLTEMERFEIPVFCTDPQAGRQIWLNLFCPDGSCEVFEASKLP